MKLSVVLPCYNGAKTIAIQLEALARQQWSQPWEVIVSNNGSTDESMAIVEQYRDRLPNLRIVNAYEPPGPRLGVAHSYNVGVRAARGEAVAFCEADDQVAPGWVAAMGEALARYDFVAGALDYLQLNEPWLIEGHGRGIYRLITPKHPPYLPFAYGCNLGMRRSLYERVGEFDESIPCAWDEDYSWRAQMAGFELHFLPEVVVHYRLRATMSGIYRQGCNWGKDIVLLLSRYDRPMKRRALIKIVMGIGLHLLQLPFIRSRGKRSTWMFQLGRRVGKVQGILKYRYQSVTMPSAQLLAAKAQRSAL